MDLNKGYNINLFNMRNNDITNIELNQWVIEISDRY